VRQTVRFSLQKLQLELQFTVNVYPFDHNMATLLTLVSGQLPSIVTDSISAGYRCLSLILVALLSLSAISLYFHPRKEHAVTFNVPLPPEVRPNWVGRSWDDISGQEKQILDGQTRGVRCLKG
jgi:hypothetical protein